MTKLIVIPKNLEMINSLMNKCDGFIIGVNNLSVNLPCSFSLEKIKDITNLLKKNNKTVFVSVNKNIHNHELSVLEETLQFLNSLPIDGIMYYDIAIVNLKEKLQLKIPLVWSQEHLTTNYLTCNFWESKDVDMVYLSSDITMNEIIAIRKNSKMNIFVNVFGYLPMFASYRHLVKNYIKTFSLKQDGENYFKISKEGKKYIIVDNDLGSFVYSNNILNGISEYLFLKENKIDYAVLNSFNIEEPDFTKIVDLFTTVNEKNVKNYEQMINQMFENIDKGFLYKETVYKVKNNE